MDQQNIDRLFREKLDGLEVNPSSQAWTQVEKQIRPKKISAIYWVAASISLLLASWLVWPEQNMDNDFILSEVNHPELPGGSDFNAPVAAELTKQEVDRVEIQEKENTKAATSPRDVQLAKIEEKALSINIEKVPEIEIQKAVALEEIELPTVEDLNNTLVEEQPEKNIRTIKITYIASSNEKEEVMDLQKSDSTGVLKKFIAFAGRIDPGEVLADMKTAKDNLISGGFKNKKERSAMAP